MQTAALFCRAVVMFFFSIYSERSCRLCVMIPPRLKQHHGINILYEPHPLVPLISCYCGKNVEKLLLFCWLNPLTYVTWLLIGQRSEYGKWFLL